MTACEVARSYTGCLTYSTAGMADSEMLFEPDSSTGVPTATLEPSGLSQYFISKKRGRSALKQTSSLLVDILKGNNAALLEDELQNFKDALLDRNGVDHFYLEILASLPATGLTELVIQLAMKYSSPQDLEIRSPVLFNLVKVIPSSVEDERVAELIMQTCLLLLSEAKRRPVCYCSEYREVAVMRFFPLLLTRKRRSPVSKEFLAEMIPEVMKFFMAAALKTVPESGAIYLTSEEIWDSVSELMTEFYRIYSADASLSSGVSSRKSPLAFWDVRQPSMSSLSVWWQNFRKPDAMWSDPATKQLNFFYRFALWSFLLCWYSTVKSDSEIPERRPFLMALTESVSTVSESSSPGRLTRLLLDAKLEKIFLLAVDVVRSLSDPENAQDMNLFGSTTDELQLEESALYLTFRHDLAMATGLVIPVRSSELHPTWLKVQLAVNGLNVALWSSQHLTPGAFLKIVDVFPLLYRTTDSTGHGNTTGISEENPLTYVWSDTEIIEYFCGVVVDHLTKQALDRATDEFLSCLMVFLQPILHMPGSARTLKNTMAVIASREKFTFKKFLTYIVSTEVISEMAQVLSTGTGVIDLTMEPLAGAVSVHKTRGANRGSTDAVLLELQRLVLTSSSVRNSCQAVSLFVKNEKEELVKTIFQQANVITLRRGRIGPMV